MNNYTYWKKEWQSKARAEGVFDAAGASNLAKNPFEFIHLLAMVHNGLNLLQSDTLLDVGCNTGLYPLALAPSVKRVDGVEYVQGFVDRARKNCAGYRTIHIRKGDILRLPFKRNTFSKVLVGSVLHYLQDETQLATALQELRRITKPKGVVLVTLIPDSSKKNDYLSGILKLKLPAVRKKEMIEKNSRGLWLDRDKLVLLAREAGFRAKVISVPKPIWQSWYMFNLQLTKI